jgi:hypothetical protein
MTRARGIKSGVHPVQQSGYAIKGGRAHRAGLN